MSTLEIISGKAAGTVVELAGKDKITLGNRRTATVVIKDPWVSFMHAVITQDGSEFLIADKRSKAGTFVNGTKIGQTGTRLKSGDEISLGKTKLRFLASSAAAAPSAAAAAPSSGPFSPVAAASSGPFTPHAPATRAAAPAAIGDAARLQSALDKANADLKSLRAAVGQREKALAEVKARNRELEAGGGDPEVAKRLKEAEALARQSQRGLRDTTTKAKIRIEELQRLNQALEARLAEGGAGNVVEMEKEIARLREEGRKLQEEARARIQELSRKVEAGGASSEALSAAQVEASEAKARISALEGELESAKASFGHAQSAKMDLEMEVEDLQGAIKKLGTRGEETAAMEALITDLGAKLAAAQDELIQVRSSALAGDTASSAASAANEGKLSEVQARLDSLEGKLKDAEGRAQKAEAEAAEAKAAVAGAQEAAAEAEAKLAEASAAPADSASQPAAGGGDTTALEARVQELEAENEGLLKDLEEINEDMLAQEEEYMERIQELEDKLAGN